MHEEKYAIFISISHDCRLVDKWHYCLIQSIACKTMNRHLVTRLKVSRGMEVVKKIVHFEGQSL